MTHLGPYLALLRLFALSRKFFLRSLNLPIGSQGSSLKELLLRSPYCPLCVHHTHLLLESFPLLHQRREGSSFDVGISWTWLPVQVPKALQLPHPQFLPWGLAMEVYEGGLITSHSCSALHRPPTST